MPPDLKRLIVKTGSSLLIAEDGTVRTEWLTRLAADVAQARARGQSVIIVTSGAVALGRGLMQATALTLEEKQALAACGQPLLMAAWAQAFAPHGIACAQLLLTAEDSEDRRRYLNARNTLETLISHGVLPIVNENDTVATSELKVGDNDRLSARVAQMAGADALVLLSDIDGLYTANPRTNPDAEFIAEVRAITPEIEAYAGGAGSQAGTGGMITKLQAAKIALGAGCHMAIARGDIDNPLKRLLEGGKATWFLSGQTPVSARKQWIAGSLRPMGAYLVDAGAAAALKSGKSLLPAGVTGMEGKFARGDAVLIRDAAGNVLGRGLSAYSSADASRILGLKSAEIERILGFKGRAALIHRDDMILE